MTKQMAFNIQSDKHTRIVVLDSSKISKSVIIDFFAPWCPPCMNFLPEFRRASTMIGGQVAFGTVDCTIHSRVCNQHNIRSYPSTIFFNNSKPHNVVGAMEEEPRFFHNIWRDDENFI